MADLATRAPTKDERLTVRVTSTQRALLLQASAAEERTLSDFILDAATTRAEQVLADRTRFVVDAEAYIAFVALLDRPVTDKSRLRSLLARGRDAED